MSACDFTKGIALLNGVIKCGCTYWIVRDNVPAGASSSSTKNRYGNTEPTKDFAVWSSYVRQFMQALVNEFGDEEVNTWRFRVGTETGLDLSRRGSFCSARGRNRTGQHHRPGP